jgi:hypothetical protein
MTPDAWMETLHDIMEGLIRQGLQCPLIFACIAADGGTLTGSYDRDRRLVVTPPAPAELPLPLHLLVVDTTANGRHVTIARATDPPPKTPAGVSASLDTRGGLTSFPN